MIRRSRSQHRWNAVLPAVAALVALATAACGSSSSKSSDTTTTSSTSSSSSTSGSVQRSVTDLVLDPNHDYGNRYADGVLPVGDNKLVLDGAKRGYVYLCNAGNATGAGGADTRGPWFVNDDTEYDINQKVHVTGDVKWQGRYSMSVSGDTRKVSVNAVPVDEPTGSFPISSSDPAYQYDRNPNHIAEQSLEYDLTADPQILSTPQCMGGEVGVTTVGVPLFSAFDAGNRDAGAWEVQDDCDGHPQMTSEYHYHTLSSCIADTGVDTVLGFALDGFPITGPKVGTNNVLTTGDLDECHGITSTIDLDGKSVTTYHYVMTEDFPYSVSCFRGTAITPPGRQR